MDAKEFFAFLVSLIVSLGIIVTIVALGWFCVWKFFLCRFRLVRELLGTANEGNSSSSSNSQTTDGGESVSKLNGGRRDSRKGGATTVTAGAYKSTRSRSRKED